MTSNQSALTNTGGLGRWGTQRSGIKEETAGRGTAAELSAPVAALDPHTLANNDS
jgi:hypothetical protein